jgi:hypothetical protein
MTRIQLETGFIDLPKGTDFPIDLSFAEITKNGARSGGVSRVIEIEGSDNNTTLLGAYFDIDLSNDTFNRNAKTVASIIQDGVEVFQGYIQLLEIVRVNRLRSTNRKKVSYKVNVFDEVGNFFNTMGDKELTDLSFPELSHVFNRENIIDSWSNTSGYTYPQFAKDDNIYTLRDFKPAIFEFEYWKKIFASNGYTFTFDQYNDEDLRIDKRIIPFNGKQGDDTVSQLLQERYIVKGSMTSDSFIIDNLDVPEGLLPPLDILNGTSINNYATATGSKIQLDTIIQDGESQYDTVNDDIENKAGQNRTVNLSTSYDYRVNVRAVNSSSTVVPFEAVNVAGGQSRVEIKVCLVAQSTTNVNKVAIIDSQQTAITFEGGETYASGWQTLASGSNASTAFLGLLDANEKFDVHALVFARYYYANGVVINSAGGLDQAVVMKDTGSSDLVFLEFDLDIDNLSFKSVPDIAELSSGVTVNIDAFIPKKIKQRDIISSIAKSYNLIFIPDPSNESNLIVKTRDKYYEDGNEWDWSDKFDESQPNSITFLSNDVKQRQVYKYKDDKDTVNSAYQSEFIETYGQTTIDLDNQYTTGTDSREIIYSPTPSIGSGIGVPLPAINGINPDCNIRVLLHNGVGTCGVYEFYDDILPVGVPEYVTEYCNTSMFDSDIVPNFSICYDAPNVLFHGFQQGQTTNYLYNLHHQQELTTINTGKRLTGYFNLSEGDFQKLSKQLDWKVFIKDNGWFFVSKIHGYNSNKKTLTKVDLITADEKLRLKFRRPLRPVIQNVLSATPVTVKFFRDVAHSTNVVLGSKDVSIDGKYNFVSAEKVKILGDRNTVIASDAIVLGDRNTVEVPGVKVVANDSTPQSSGVSQGGEKVFKAKVFQSGTNAPRLTIIKNDFGGTITTSRVTAGGYGILGFNSQLTGNVEVSWNFGSFVLTKQVLSLLPTTSTVVFSTYDSGVQSDDCFVGSVDKYITITKYP